jgi:hypothetical protein
MPEEHTLELRARLGDKEAEAELGDATPSSLAELEVNQWLEHLSLFDRKVLVRAAIEVVSTILDEWTANRPDDKRPLKAVDAANGYLMKPGENTKGYALAAAKACTAARKDSFGYEHRIAEAARAVARAAVANSHKTTIEAVVEAISKTEEHILYRYAVDAIYNKEVEVRSELLSVVRNVLLSPNTSVNDLQTNSEFDPVGYSASGSFNIGQKVAHSKFGICKVIDKSESWIEIETENGETKKLAHQRR